MNHGVRISRHCTFTTTGPEKQDLEFELTFSFFRGMPATRECPGETAHAEDIVAVLTEIDGRCPGGLERLWYPLWFDQQLSDASFMESVQRTCLESIEESGRDE